jgi:hypothetical protein
MTSTVEAIGDRLDPANVVAGAKDAVRDATVGKVENMTSQATEFIGDATASVQDAGGGLVEIVRRNPVPALMAGAGIGWLWMSWNKTGDRNRAGRTQPADAWLRREGPITRDASGPGMGERAGEVVDSIGGRVGDVGDRVGAISGEVTDTAGDLAGTTRQMVTDNALAAGVVAAALGAAVGLLLPATETERRVMGDAGGRVIDAAQTTATEAIANVES